MKFVIVCSSRTGSTMLNGGFNNHPKFSGFDEAMTARGVTYENLNPELQGNFDPYIKFQRQWRFSHCLWFWIKNIKKQDIPYNADTFIDRKILRKWLNWLYSRDENVVFKLLHPHVEIFPFCVDVLNEMSVKIIHLVRDEKERVASMRHKFNPKESDGKLLEITRQENDDIINWFPERLIITYEELTDNKEVTEFPKDVVKKMFDYIGVDYEPELTVWQKKVRK